MHPLQRHSVNMKLVAVFLLAACLVQGNNAQSWGMGIKTLGHIGSGIWNGVSNAVKDAAASPQGEIAKKAINCWLGWCNDDASEEAADASAAANAAATAGGAAGAAVIIGNMPGLEFLSASSEGVLGSALSGMEEEELTELADKLTVAEHLETILGAQIAVAEQSMSIAERLRTLIYGPVALGGCAPEKVAEASDLCKKVGQIPMTAANFVKEGYFGFRECSEHSTPQSRKRCEGETQVPVTVQAAIMVKETNDFTMEAISTIKVLRREFGKCARANKNAEAAKAALKAVEDAADGMAKDINAAADAASSAVVNAAQKAARKAAA